MEYNDILTVAVDTIKGVNDKYSKGQTSEELRQAMIEMNGGSTKLNVKKFHRGSQLFELVEELVPVILDEGIKADNNYLFKLIDYRNLADGDEQSFYIEGKAHFVVATVASGIQGVRRQRIVGGAKVNVDIEVNIVRVYENLARLLAGKISFDKFVDGVAEAFKNDVAAKAYAALAGLTASTYGLSADYVKSGSVTVENALTLAEHVAAATGKTARFVGTRAALRKAFGNSITQSAEQNSDLYNQGYLGKVNGVECIALDQAHVPGTDTFALANDAFWVIAGDEKIIKFVTQGEGYMDESEPSKNADLSKEYVYLLPYGVAAVVSEKIGYWHSIV